MRLRPFLLLAAGLALAGAPMAQGGIRVDRADALIKAVFVAQDAARYDAAAQAYLGLLSALDRPRDAEADAVLLRHLRQLAPVVPTPERRAWNLDQALEDGSLHALPLNTGSRVVRWWRAQDDLPATPANERLNEHLARVAHARSAFEAPRDPRGYDDRGETYVRLGPPDERVAITVSPSVVAFDLDVPRSWTRVPANELWVYRSVRKGLHYLFVRPAARRPFREGRATDLVPPPLRNAGRGRDRLDALLIVMEEIYGQLAVRDPAYGAVFDEVMGLIGGGSVAEGAPASLAQGLLGQAEAEDLAVEGARATLAPRARSLTRDGTEPLDAALRWARFRQPDGATSVVLHWGLEAASALRPSRRLTRELRRSGVALPDDAWVSVSLARLTRDGTVGDVEHAHRRVDLQDDAPLVASVEVPLLDDPAALAVQWQGRLGVSTGGGASRPGRRTKLDTRQLAPLSPLPRRGLVLSDVQVLTRAPGVPQAAPHPFATLPSGPLVLRFGVYGLTTDAEGQARYRVELEVREPGAAGETATAFDASLRGTTSDELIEVDTTPYSGRAITLAVRLTDLVSGEGRARTLTFDRP